MREPLPEWPLFGMSNQLLAACGLISLTKMTQRLQDDHDNAKDLGTRLAGLPGLEVDASLIKINMVYWRPTAPGFDANGLVAFLKERGVIAGRRGRQTRWRMQPGFGVDHKQRRSLMSRPFAQHCEDSNRPCLAFRSAEQEQAPLP